MRPQPPGTKASTPLPTDSSATQELPTPNQNLGTKTAPAIPRTYPRLLGTERAVLWAPNEGAISALLILAHGAGGTPEWHCDYWTQQGLSQTAVLCLRGARMFHDEEAYFFPNHNHLARLLAAALDQVEALLGSRLGEARRIFIGYSQGATMGGLILHRFRHRFAAGVLLEGGNEQWPVRLGIKTRQAGIERLVLVCGTASCARAAKRSLGWLQRAGIDARLEHAPHAGHTPAGAVGARATQAVHELIQHDPVRSR